ncbi:MAG TPA: cell division protein FtsA [Stenotrophobium sp.]|nr:cell division protein FtsA [Stenotrophobium sp.]
MSKREVRNLLVGLDIGTSKAACVIGEVMPEGHVEVVGEGSAQSRGLKKGVVVNIEATVQSIRRALENAEQMAGCRAQSVYVGVSGSHIKSFNSTGVVPVRGREVHARDVDAVIDAARAIAIPADQKILHVVPQEFVVDGQDGIHEPVGMSGVRLEAHVHMVTGSLSAAQNLYKCVESCGLRVDKLILQHLAASDAVLMPDERDLGVCMVDIGGGTSDIAIYKGGSVRHTAVLPIAGDQVTNDISVAFRTPVPYAEEIKVRFGCALPEFTAHDEMIEVKTVGDLPARSLSRHTLAEVIRPRYEELFRFIRKELHRSDFYDVIASGMVLTGGSAQMPGVRELAEAVFELPVRIGMPHNIRGLKDVVGNPAYSTAVGLLLYGMQDQPRLGLRGGEGGGLGYLMGRINSWFKGNF